MAWCHQAPSHYLNQCWHGLTNHNVIPWLFYAAVVWVLPCEVRTEWWNICGIYNRNTSMFDLALLENDQAVSSVTTYTHTVMTNSLFQVCMELHGIVHFFNLLHFHFISRSHYVPQTSLVIRKLLLVYTTELENIQFEFSTISTNVEWTLLLYIMLYEKIYQYYDELLPKHSWQWQK